MLDRRREFEEAASADEDAAANGVGVAEAGGEGGEAFRTGECGGSCEVGDGTWIGADIEASMRRRKPSGQVPAMRERPEPCSRSQPNEGRIWGKSKPTQIRGV
jgi:hypothetical protein